MQQEKRNGVVNLRHLVNKVNAESINVGSVVMPLIHFGALLFPAEFCLPCLNEILDGPAGCSVFPT